MEEKTTYKSRVWQFLDEMQPGDVYRIDKVCKEETRDVFIEATKDYMDTHPWQGWLSFNKDYTKIYKTHPIEFKNQ